MFRYIGSFSILAALTTCASAQPDKSAINPDPKSLVVAPEDLSKARELVQKLGNEDYNQREAAERELASMGRLALQALLDGVTLDADPEVRARCAVLLPKANSAEMKARLDTFLADSENKFDHDLPGWNQLRAVVRGEWQMLGWTFTSRPNADRAARELFLEFMKAPGGRKLLMALGGPPADLGQMVAARKQELYSARLGRVPGNAPRTPGAMEVAVILFAESQVSSKLVPRTPVFTTVVTTSGISAAAQGTSNQAIALRAVMGAWFDSRYEPAEMYSAMTMANNMQNTEAAGRLAVRMINMPGVQGVYKGQALSTIVKLKLIDQLPALEKAMTDSTVLTTVVRVVNGMQIRQTVELRDAALAAAISMTGQDPTDYGFDSFPKGAAAGVNFNYTWAKIDENKRDDALAKWKEWREKNP